ncbi:MAG: universal stress protein [Gammaproteobacteria bacterium]|nr:MAG: universal stress protein [Gammaproteobacteria bacterium]
MAHGGLREDPLHPPGARPASTATSRVLVCLDRSELSESVLSYAVMLARAAGGSLTLLNVVESSGDITSESHDALVWELKRHEARQYMGQLLERIRRLDIPVDIRIEEGRPAEQILGFVRQHPVDFLILASHGAHGLAEWSLSSTAAKIISRTHSSLAIVPATPVYQHPEQATCVRRILVPLDDSPRSLAALPLAVRIARQQHAELILAHAVEPASFHHYSAVAPADREILDSASSILESVAQNYFRQVAARLKGEGIEVSVIVIPSPSPAELIYEIVASRNIDFIAMTAHGSSASEQFSFARTAAHLISHAPVPLLVIQDLDRQQMSRCLCKRRYDSAPLTRGRSTVDDIS